MNWLQLKRFDGTSYLQPQLITHLLDSIKPLLTWQTDNLRRLFCHWHFFKSRGVSVMPRVPEEGCRVDQSSADSDFYRFAGTRKINVSVDPEVAQCAATVAQLGGSRDEKLLWHLFESTQPAVFDVRLKIVPFPSSLLRFHLRPHSTAQRTARTGSKPV